MNKNIAIDGPSGAGKSTIAKCVAKKLNYVYVDTGAMYRTIGYYYFINNLDIESESVVNDNLDKINIDIKYIDGLQHIYLNKEDVSDKIRTETGSKYASIVSKYKLVREKLVSMQQDIAKNTNVVMDGRDIGSVVLPDAKLKVYLDASVDIRANRRYKENILKGINEPLEVIKEDIIERDYRDMHRENSPLVRCSDAVYIDSSDMTIDEVAEKIVSLVGDLNEKND